MNDVVDAKIVKIIRVNSCAECPYLGTGVSRDIDGNETEYVCAHPYIVDNGIDHHIGLSGKYEVFWSKCPLPSSICVTTEEVQD